jgi:flagellar protein FlgJ
MNITDKSMMMYNNANLDRMKAFSAGTLNKEDKELREACKDFETLFVKQMLDSMRKTVEKADKSDNNGGKDYFEDMLYDNYAKKMSETANLGIAKMMYQQLYKSV